MLERATAWGIVTLGLAALAGCGGERSDSASGGAGTGDAHVGQARPNVVVISVDTLRPDHLACYGYGRATSPSIDRLAAEGALFEAAISSTSWTLPAHAALFTGLVDAVHGCYDSDRRLESGRTTLAERLKAEGYATAGFFSGPFLHPVFGMSQGFDTYVDCTSYADLNRATVSSAGTVAGARIENASHRDVTSGRLYDAASGWLKAHRGGRPFFVFMHLWDVHFDYIPPAPYDTMFDPDYEGSVTAENFFFNERIHAGMGRRDLEHVIALYDGEIAWTDLHVGKLLDELDLHTPTLVILVSDHGTEFFEHGGKVHRRTLFDESIRIPMIMRYPGRIPAGMRLAEQVRIIDVVPTVLDLLGIPRPGDVMGQSLVPLLEGLELEEDNLALSELLTLGFSLESSRRTDRKMITDGSGPTRMFDLEEDSGEQSPVSDVESGLPWVRALVEDRKRGREWVDEYRGKLAVGGVAPDLPEGVRRQLQSLGYIGSDEGTEGAVGRERSPDPFDLELSIAMSLIDVGRTGEALEVLGDLVAAYPDSARAHVTLADALAAQGRPNDAVPHYEAAVRLEDGLFAPHFNLAEILLRAGQPERAVTHFMRAVEIRPRSAVAHEGLGRTFVQLGQLDGAITAFRNVVAIDPGNANAQCNVGILLGKKGDLPAAVDALELALEIDPNHARARQELARTRASLR